MARPVPAHGTEGRYKGAKNRPGCRCTICRRGRRHAQIRRDRIRLNGGSNTVPRTILAAHIKTLTDSGMSQQCISRQANVAQATISYLINGRIENCQRAQALRILAVLPNTLDDKAWQPALPSIRRIRALYAAAHSSETIAAASSLGVDTISVIAAGTQKRIRPRAAAGVLAAYKALANSTGTSSRNQKRAERLGWGPPATWDDDTIADPSAHPDWTGHCGTDRGWWLHRANNIPVCKPCTQAHQEWCAQHKHLDGKQRWVAAAKARAAAASRGAAIAANARELFAQGYTTDQVALRLGVGRDRIDQELRRHPNATNDLEAAA